MKKFNIALLLLDEPSAKYSGVMNLIKELKSDDRFNVYFMYDKHGKNNQVVLSNIESAMEFSGDLVTGDNPFFDIVIVTNPYRRVTPDYSKWTSKVVYDEYGCAGHEAGTGNLTSRRIYKLAWLLVVDTPAVKDSLIKKFKSSEDRIVVGKPAYDYPQYLDKLTKTDDRPVVMWSPHCSVYDYDYYHNIIGGRYSTFLTYKDLFISYLPKKYPNIKFKIKLHPSLGSRLHEAQHRGDVDNSFKLKDWIEEVSKNENVEVMDPNENYSQAFVESSAILNDSISFISEYLPTKKPMLVLRDEGRANYSDATEKLVSDIYYNADNMHNICFFLEHVVLNGNDPNYLNRVEALKYLMPHTTTNSKALVDIIHKRLSQEVES